MRSASPITTPERVQIVDEELPEEVWLTSLHSPALTAYLALEQCARPMPGQKMVVTSAAGAVGSGVMAPMVDPRGDGVQPIARPEPRDEHRRPRIISP